MMRDLRSVVLEYPDQLEITQDVEVLGPWQLGRRPRVFRHGHRLALILSCMTALNTSR